MADRVADLVIKLRADTAALDRALRSSERNVESTSTRIKRSLLRIRKGLVEIGSAATVAATALAAATRGALNRADQLGKVADRIGVTTEELQRLRFSADLAGVSSEKLDKAIETFVRRIGEARVGTGEMVEKLSRLDQELVKNILSADSTEEQFLLVVDAINKAGDAATRTAIANAAFGRGVAALVNLALQGRDAIRAQGDELERFGRLLTREAAAGAEAANDAIKELTTFLRQSFTVALLGAGDKTRALADELRDEELRKSVSELGTRLGELARQLIELAERAPEALRKLEAFVNSPAFRIAAGAAVGGRLGGLPGAAVGGLIGALSTPPDPNLFPEDEILKLARGIAIRQQVIERIGAGSKTVAELERLNERDLKRIQEIARKRSALDIPPFDPFIGLPGERPNRPSVFIPSVAGVGNIGGIRGGLGALADEEIRKREQAEIRLTSIIEREIERRFELAGQEVELIKLRTEAQIAQLDELARIIPDREADIQLARIRVIENAETEIERIQKEAIQRRAEADAEAAAAAKERFAEQLSGVTSVISQTISGLLLQQERDWDAFFRSLVASFVSRGVDQVLGKLVDAISTKAASSNSSASSSSSASGIVTTLLSIAGLFFADGGIVRRATVGVIGESGPEAVIPLDRLDKLVGGGGVEVNVIGAPPGTITERRMGPDGRETIDVLIAGANARNAQRGFGRQRHVPGAISA